MPYIGPPPQNRILSSADIAQGAVTLDDINFTDQPTNMDITGLIDKHTMRLADGVTITGDVTISDDLVLSKISDDGNAITMTNDGSSRTITGSGSIEASTLSQTPNQSLTGMTGTIGSAVTGGSGLTSIGTATDGTSLTSLGTVTTGTFEGTLNSNTTFSGSAGKITAKVWVTYKGTDTVAEHDSFGVSSVTDNGTGQYTVNFLTPFSNIYYCSVGMSGHNTTKLKSVSQPIGTTPPTTTSCMYETVHSDGGIADAQIMMIAIFGD